MDRWLVPAIAAVAALAIGFAIGAAVSGGDDAVPTEPTTEQDEEEVVTETDPEVQETCLAALDAAEQEVQVEQRTSDLLDEYEDVVVRATEALADFDTRRLEQLLSEVETLNRRSDRLVDDARTAELEEALETCRTLLGAEQA